MMSEGLEETNDEIEEVDVDNFRRRGLGDCEGDLGVEGGDDNQARQGHADALTADVKVSHIRGTRSGNYQEGKH